MAEFEDVDVATRKTGRPCRVAVAALREDTAGTS